MFSIYKNKAIQWNKSISLGKIDFGQTNIAIIGGTNGIGRAITHELVKNGANVTVVGRTFRDNDLSSKIKFLKADSSLIEESERIGKELNTLNSQKNWTHLVFTTGVVAATTRQETQDGIERDMAISYLSRYIILNDMATNLKKKFAYREKGQPGRNLLLKPRVFVMGFPGSQQLGNPRDLNATGGKYNGLSVHSNTVAANEALVMKLTYSLPNKQSTSENGFNIYGLNPGIIHTDIRSTYYGQRSWMRAISEWIISKVTQDANSYAKKIVPLLMTPDIETHNGAIFNNNGDAIYPSKGMTPNLVEEFQEYTKQLIEFAKTRPQ